MPDDQRVISCRVCGAIMMKLSRDICQKCFLAEEEEFNVVREYLRVHPGVSLKQVARETKVPEAQINRFVSSGRLERGGVIVEHTCQTCHRQISSGIICPECAKDLKTHLKQLREEVSKPKTKPDDKDGGFHSGKTKK